MLTLVDKHNADTLFNYPQSHVNFDIRGNGELCVISWYNVLGRFIKWIRNFHGDITVKVNKVVKETLEKIQQHNDAANPKDYSTMFYLRKEHQGWFFNSYDPFSDYYPAYFLGQSILSNHQFVGYGPAKQSKLMREIKRAADKLTKDFKSYPIWNQLGPHRRAEEYKLPWDWNA